MRFSDFGIDTKGRKSGQFKTQCPKCSDDRKNKRDPSLSVNIDEGVWNCHHCGFAGTVNKMEKIKYTVPELNNTPLSDKTLEYFKGRGISKSTVLRFGVTESESNGKKWINFNYFRDEKLVNIKFRSATKEFRLSSGSELIFYGLDLIKGYKACVICEGEFDALAFYESEVFQVVSVPNGASKGSQKLEYLDNCWEWFEGIEKIIIATDNDLPGIALREELARRLGKERCFILEYPEGTKDANDILLRFGAKELRERAANAIEYPLEGITTIADVEERINDLYENGLKRGETTGFTELDKLITFRPGEMTVITGIPGSGKSEFTDQIMVRLAMKDWKLGVFSAENCPIEFHFAKLAEKYTGRNFYGVNPQYKMNSEDLTRAKFFINDRFFFVDTTDDNLTLDNLLKKAKELVKRKGINAFLLDPWNYVEHKIPQGFSETQYISEALTKIARAAKSLNIHFFIVAHPVKIKKDKDGNFEIPTLYDIAGSANWFNKADNGICVYRDFQTNAVRVYVQKIRFKHIGQIGMAEFKWDKFTGRYTELGEQYEPEFTELENNINF
jgi:twinkle protein